MTARSGQPKVNEVTRERGRPQHRELGVEGVVVEPGSAERDASLIRVGCQRGRVIVDRAWAGGCARDEQVHAERGAGQGSCLLDLLLQRAGGEVTGRQESQPACIIDSRRELRRRRAAGHRGCHDRNLQPVQYHQLPPSRDLDASLSP